MNVIRTHCDAEQVFPNGTVLMLTRKYNGTAAKLHIVPHDTIWLVRAPSFAGPYELVFDRPVFENELFNEEDPCAYSGRMMRCLSVCSAGVSASLSLTHGASLGLPL